MVRTNNKYKPSDKDIQGAIRILEKAKTKASNFTFYFYTPHGMVECSNDGMKGTEKAIEWFKQLLITSSHGQV